MSSPVFFKTITRTTRTLIWTETENGWKCGHVEVLPWKREAGKWVWQVFLDGKLISRCQGYSSDAEARRAAGRHKAVVKLMEEPKP